MGESSRLETAIEVTGLKPGHFYNVRVIAVGGNHFQAGSAVLRLSTLCKDGRPQQGHSGPPSTKDEDDQDSESNEETQTGRGHGVEIQAATLPESPQIPMVREHSGGHPGGGSQAGQRRNTGGRKHSPSTAAADQAARERAIANVPEESMQQLTEKFEHTRKDTEDTAVTIAKESEDFKVLFSDLTKDRDAKKQLLKDKEEQSEKVKKEASNAERLNRTAQNKRKQREKVLQEKKLERDKWRGDIAKWKREIESMRNEQKTWREEKEQIGKVKEDKISEIQTKITEQQLILEGLENDLHIRGRQIRDLEADRMQPGAEDDEESKAREANDRKEEAEWQAIERTLVSKLNSSSQRLRDIELMISQQQAHLTGLEAAHRAAAQPIMFHGNSSGVDFDPTGGPGKAKPRRTRNRKSRTSTISSPISAYPITDSPFPSASVYNNLGNAPSPAFVAPPPYIQMNNDTGMVIQADHISGMSEDEIRMLTAGAPLSPTATSLLPSNIFADDDHDEQDGRAPPFGHALYGNIGDPIDKDPQSPDSSSRSASLISSPRNSSHNLAAYGVPSHDYVKDNERRSIKSPFMGYMNTGSPSTETTAHKGLMDLFGIPRTRGKTIQEDGPALGSLKHGQSQSFPRSSEEPESFITKPRRISLSSASWGGLFKGSPAPEPSAQGNAPAPARNFGARNRRGFPIFSNSVDEPNHRSERDPSSPRPLSIASSDLPRPSTDSAPFGWGPTQDSLISRNSPLATNWSVHMHPAPPTWSRNPSRRPSIQHGSSSALTTGIASDDDEFLPSSDSFAGPVSPPSAGVIGTRPVSSHKPPTPKLNPAAPAFQKLGLSFTSKSNKGKAKAKAIDSPTSPEDPPPHDSTNLSSPAASRKSRDAHSIRTQNSMAESHESLDRAASNTTSEFPSGSSSKEKESSAFRQLLRKGSSSKFSISSFRSKENGLFSGKKGVSSTPNSDRGLGDHRDNSFDEYGEDAGLGRSVDSVTSSPMIGSTGSGEWKGKEKEAGTPKEGRMSVGWGRFISKKGKGRESSEVERSEAEVTGDEA